MNRAQRQTSRRAGLVLVCLALWAAGCRGPQSVRVQDVYAAPELGYRAALAGGAWNVEEGQTPNVRVFTADNVSGLMAIEVTPLAARMARPIPVLGRELFLDFKDIEILSRTPRVVSGCDGLCYDVLASVNGKPVRARACVFIHERRVFDLMCSAPRDQFEPIAGLFEAMVAGFKVEPVVATHP